MSYCFLFDLSRYRAFLLIPVLLWMFTAGSILVLAEQTQAPKKIQKRALKTIEVLQKTQKKETCWQLKKAELTVEYSGLTEKKRELVKRRAKKKVKIEVAKKKIDEIERKIRETARVKEDLQECLEAVFFNMEELIRKDLPFLADERSNRLAIIREDLVKLGTNQGEKFRTVFEALKIETEYGNTVEVYQDTVNLDGKPVMADILRLGRISLFCRTPDGKTVGHYDRASKQWTTLPSSSRHGIGKAIEIASRNRTADFVNLPIGRIVVQ